MKMRHAADAAGLAPDTKWSRRKTAAANWAVTVGMIAIATLLSLGFRWTGMHESNFIMTYILGVLLVARLTDGYIYGMSASIIGVLAFNFFFTEPYYTFIAYRADYPVTFAVMLAAAVMTSALTTRAKREAEISSGREQRAQILYRISRSLLATENISQIAETGVENIAKLYGRIAIMATVDEAGRLGEPYVHAVNDARSDLFHTPGEKQAMEACASSGLATGSGTDRFPSGQAYYLPLLGQSGCFGVIGISCTDRSPLSGEQKKMLEAVSSQLAMAMEREKLLDIQQRSKMEIEREQLRGNLLRAVSHDLRTPLAGILGSAAALLNHDDTLEPAEKEKLLQGIYEDTSWLIHSIENILSMTRMDEGNLSIHKSMEAVEEVVGEAISRVEKLLADHTIRVRIPDELVMLPMDGILIEQVLVNLLDNAIKHTPPGSAIDIDVQAGSDRVVFEVADNGSGIPEAYLNSVFDRFFTVAESRSERRGTGLGLSICRSIVAAHGGDISAFNNESGGATFRFALPRKE